MSTVSHSAHQNPIGQVDTTASPNPVSPLEDFVSISPRRHATQGSPNRPGRGQARSQAASKVHADLTGEFVALGQLHAQAAGGGVVRELRLGVADRHALWLLPRIHEEAAIALDLQAPKQASHAELRLARG